MPQKRSCQSCYRRKVKCDKKLPCSTCRDQSQTCEYPQEPIRRRRNRQIPIRGLQEAEKSDRTGKGEDSSYGRHDRKNAQLIDNGEGQSRLVSSDFWANVEDEVSRYLEPFLYHAVSQLKN